MQLDPLVQSKTKVIKRLTNILTVHAILLKVFPTFDLSGHRITTVHSHYRILASGCTLIFSKPKCEGGCSSCNGKKAKAKCYARRLKCKGTSLTGISFPFM